MILGIGYGKIIKNILLGTGFLNSPLLLAELTPSDVRGKIVGYTELVNTGKFSCFLIENFNKWSVMSGYLVDFY